MGSQEQWSHLICPLWNHVWKQTLGSTLPEAYEHKPSNPQHNSIHTDGEQEDEYLLKLWPDRGEEESHVSHSVIDLYYFQCKSF